MMDRSNSMEKKYTIVPAEVDYSSTASLAKRLEEELNKAAEDMNPRTEFKGIIPVENVSVTDDVSKIKLLAIFENTQE